MNKLKDGVSRPPKDGDQIWYTENGKKFWASVVLCEACGAVGTVNAVTISGPGASPAALRQRGIREYTGRLAEVELVDDEGHVACGACRP
jgi:hypothetical protein